MAFQDAKGRDTGDTTVLTETDSAMRSLLTQAYGLLPKEAWISVAEKKLQCPLSFFHQAKHQDVDLILQHWNWHLCCLTFSSHATKDTPLELPLLKGSFVVRMPLDSVDLYFLAKLLRHQILQLQLTQPALRFGALGIMESFDNREPYPWELTHDDEDEIRPHQENQTQQDLPVIDRVDLEALEIQVNTLRRQHGNHNAEILVITYGVGLVTLGRRDFRCPWQNIGSIVNMIQDTWADHGRNGNMTVHYVMAQPENLDDRPYVVFLVHIDYGMHHVDDRCVLVQEHGDSDSGAADHLYGAIVHTHVTPRSIMAQLGHAQCFPQGVQDFTMRVAGAEVDVNTIIAIQSGYSCELSIDYFPQHVVEADRRMYHAKDFFQQARAIHENVQLHQGIIIRVHGISPANVPLGYRDIPCQYECLRNLEWLRTARTLWPFREDLADFVFVVAATTITDEFDAHVLHCIVNYNCESDGAPILVRQQIKSVNQGTTVHEVWSVVVDRDANRQKVKPQLTRHPFWVRVDLTAHMYRDSEALRDQEQNWRHGQILDLHVEVVDNFFLMTGLLDLQRRADATVLEEEEVSMLHTHLHVNARGNAPS